MITIKSQQPQRKYATIIMVNKMTKQEIRRNIKIKRTNLTQEEVEVYSNIIFQKTIKLLQEYNYKDFFVYKDFKNEVSTKKIIDYLLVNDKKVYLPVINKDYLKTVQISNKTKYLINSYGIEEPIGHNSNINNFVCIMPLLAIDQNGNRIGFGKGYYDKFLQNKNCIKIGLCYDFQIIDNIKSDTHDVPLDIIISEKRIINRTNKR